MPAKIEMSAYMADSFLCEDEQISICRDRNDLQNEFQTSIQPIQKVDAIIPKDEVIKKIITF